MAIGINDKEMALRLTHNLEDAQRSHADSMEKLATGQVFTAQDPRPADRALAEHMDFRLRSLATSKRSISDGISLLQTAESSLSEINNMILRMKELNVAASNTTLNDRERRYLFVEYEALRDEINRVATTTEFNGIPLLNGQSDKVPDQLVLRIDEPYVPDNRRFSPDEDINAIRFDGLKNIVATAEGLGLKSTKDLLSRSSDDGISVDDAQDIMTADEDSYSTIYDQALNTLSTQRSVFGAMQSRLQQGMNFLDVYQENLAAAKANIADTDYAKEAMNMAQSSILMQAATGMLAQSNINANLSLNLLASVLKRD